MNIRDAGNMRVVDIEKNAISQQDIVKLKKLLNTKVSKKHIGINLKEVKYIDSSFVDLLKISSEKQKLSIFNLNNDIYLLLFVLKAEKYADIYLDERDFCTQKNLVVYRRLKLLKTA